MITFQAKVKAKNIIRYREELGEVAAKKQNEGIPLTGC